ncbi:MAG: nucleotide exchange factor GrpE [Caldisericaceae bacterium]
MSKNEEKKDKNVVSGEEISEPKVEESTQKAEGNELEKRVKQMEELLKEKDDENFNLKMENIKLKEKLRQEGEIFERETKRRILLERIKIFKEFLEILDNIERAFATLEGDSEQLKGILLIKEQLDKFLKSFGVREMDVENKPFNPNICDVGEVVETDERSPNTVIKTLRKGYYIGDDILRTAVVSVAVPKNKNSNSENQK